MTSSASHLTPREARLYLIRTGLTGIERSWIDTHLVRCGECAALVARIGGYGEARSEEEARNQVGDGR